MKHFLIAINLFLISICACAQDNNKAKGQISGKVIDSFSKTVVDYAAISIFKGQETLPFNGASSDMKGNFTIDKIPVGTYRVVIDFVGYQRKTISDISVTDIKTHVALGSVLLSPASKQLQTVTINGQRSTIENKIDKIVFNTGNDITSQGGVALDVLKKVPQVSVDIDGNVEVQGNTNIRFLINGKPSSIFGASLADALQSIPASQIKSIEVITSPGSRYDASGTGGIINIILKDNKAQGINGNVNLSGGTRLENGSFNINARKGNLGINAFLNGNEQLNSTTISDIDRTSVNAANDTSTRLIQKGNNAFKRRGYQTGLSVNMSITPHDELTASFTYNHFGNTGNGLTGQEQAGATAGNMFSDILSTRYVNTKFQTRSSDLSLAYRKTFKKKDQQLDILYSSTYGDNVTDFSQQQDYQTTRYQSSGIQSHNPGQDNETDISIDYTQPVNDNLTLETGAKLVMENISNTVVSDTLLENGSYVLNTNQSYAFTYKRNIYAYYLSAGFSLFNKFIEGKAGLRYERTEATADFPGLQMPPYDILAPSFVLSHKLGEGQLIKFSYSYRIQRPDYGDLNPFYNISDPHNITTGNPTLKPEIGHNYELGYNKTFTKGPSIYIAAVYRYNTNDIQTYTTFYPILNIDGANYTDVSLNQRYNIGSEVSAGANIYANIPVTGKFSLRSNMFFADRITNNPGSPQTSGFMARLNLNASYEFAHDLTTEVFGNYRSRMRTIQGKTPAFSFYTIAVRKLFLHKKASIGITMTDPFNEYINQRATTSGQGFSQDYLRQVPYRSIGISATYKFGKLEFKVKDKDENTAPQPIEN